MLVDFKTLNIILKSILHFLLHRGWRLHPATYLFSLFLVQVLGKDKGRIFFLRDIMWLSLVSVTSPFWKTLYLSSSWKQEVLLCHMRAVLTWVSGLGIRRSCRGGSKSSRWPVPPPPNLATTFKSHAWSSTPLCLLGRSEVPSHLPSVAQFWATGHMLDPSFIPPRDQNSMQWQRPIIILLPEGQL